MCGRFSLFATEEELREQFSIHNISSLELKKRYNIAPSQQVLSIINDGNHNRAGFLTWGLIASWAKDRKIGYRMINARAETVDQKRSFKQLLQRRRCLIVADGFYEWKGDGKQKQAYRIHLKNKRPFAFAGLWDRWESEEETIYSCTIITTTANELIKDLHERMPVILSKEQQQKWLDPTARNPLQLKGLLHPYPAEEMTFYAVSSLVNSPKNDHDEVLLEQPSSPSSSGNQEIDHD